MRTIPDMNTYLKVPLLNHYQKILPTLMESIVFDDERNLHSLSIDDGSLGIPILQVFASIHCESLKAIAAPLVRIIINQIINTQQNSCDGH